MIRILTWLVAASLFAVVAHIAYVLFLPRYEMNRLIGEAAGAVGTNTFAVLDATEQELILKQSGRTAVAGLCPFDLSTGTLVFDAALPDAIWSFAIYSETGKDAYAINETQAGTNRFRLTVTQSPGLIGMLWGEASDSGVITDGWAATTPSSRGLAVLWVALDDRQLRSAYADVMKKSTCRIEPEA
jgi:uncharacterized membrane protein